VFRQFGGAFALTLAVVLALFLVVDGATKVEDFYRAGRQDLPLFVLRYYAFHPPFIFMQVAPVVTLVAAAFTLGRLQRQGELTPILASGVSLHRVLRPVCAFAALAGAVTLALDEWVTPAAGEAIRERTLSARGARAQFNVIAEDPRGAVVLFVGKYTPATAEMENVHVLEMAEGPPGTGADLTEWSIRGRVFAWTGRYDPADGWILGDGYRYAYDAVGARVGDGAPARFESLPYPRLRLKPIDVEHQGEAGRIRSLTRLAREVADAPDLLPPRLELHTRLAQGLAPLALLLAGLPLVLRREVRSIVLPPLLAGGVCAAWFLLQAIAQQLGTAAIIPPALAGYGPPAILLALGIACADAVPT
jgi:lipopolysaccharide export LptBFGC system permease protein LptF